MDDDSSNEENGEHVESRYVSFLDRMKHNVNLLL